MKMSNNRTRSCQSDASKFWKFRHIAGSSIETTFNETVIFLWLWNAKTRKNLTHLKAFSASHQLDVVWILYVSSFAVECRMYNNTVPACGDVSFYRNKIRPNSTKVTIEKQQRCKNQKCKTFHINSYTSLMKDIL